MSRRERQRRRSRNRGHPVKRVLVMAGILGGCAIGLGALAVAGWVAAVADSAPSLGSLTANTPGALSQVFATDGSSLGYIHSVILRTPVAASEIPNSLKHATVAIEDRRFYHHGALDYQGILRAAIKDLFGGGQLQGASTLTMQLIDNLYLKHVTHNLHYKIIQAKLAQELYKKYNRAWILNEYLNDVPYGTVGGQTAYGAGAAAQVFFNKPVSQLDLAQSALLAGLPQAPSEYNPFLQPRIAHRRRHDVLQAMVKSGYITQAQADSANAEPLGVQRNNAFAQRSQPYAFDFIVQQLHQRFCPNRPPTAYCKRVDAGGLKIYSTIDPKYDNLAKQAILSHEGGPGQPAAALTSIDPSNGHVIAIANSSDYSQSSFDYATQGQRSPGSSFKVFALMTLIHDYDGDPSQTFYNSHFLAPGWLTGYPTYSVHTAEQSYAGDISVAKATTVSDNTVFAQLAVDLGMDKFDQTAHAMGITSTLSANPSEVIGGLTYGVTTLEMADAYATISNGGWHIPPTAIDHVVFPNGQVVSLANPPRNRVFTDGETYTATTVLKTVVTSGTGTAADYGCPAAGKTGTAQNLSNGWFVGYTPKLSTAVWVGYPNNNNLQVGFGGTVAAPIWHDFMQVASNGFCGDWTPPTTPWTGTAFTGPHSSAPPVKATPNAGNGGGNPYLNPKLYAQPPQGTPTVPKPTRPPGFGTGHQPGSGGTGKTH
jgi:penicillin-binding protein 1A